MRFINIKTIFSLVAFSFLAMVATAQFDDLYYDPNDNSGSILDSEYTDTEDTYVYDEVDEYDSDYDSDYNDEYYDDYSYTRRINRFRRNSCSANNYYSSVFYNDPFYSDPYLNPYFPGATSLIHISFGNGYGNGYRRWNRFNRWNRWDNWGNNYGYNSWNSWGYNSWNNPYCPPNYGYGYANSGFGGYGNNYGNTYYNNVNVTNNPNGTHYGSRRNGSVSSSTNGRTKTHRLTSPREDETGVVSASSPSSTRSSGVRTKRGDGKTSDANLKSGLKDKSENTKSTSRRRSNGDTIYSGRKRSSRSSTTGSSDRRNSNQGVSRRNTTKRNNSSMSNRRNSSRSNSNLSKRSNNTNRSSTRSSSTRSSTKSSSRSTPKSSSRSSSKRSGKRGGE